MREEIAKIKLVRVVKYVGHYCKQCQLASPPLICQGEVLESGEIKWAVFNNMYRMLYCPFCGGELPRLYGKKPELLENK